MAVFLTIHARYKDVQWGIFREAELVEAGADESKKVSKNFIHLLDRLLKKNKLAFSELSFIAAHQGPAPFTTLRVCLSTVNGFAFATGIPLIGINGLEVLIDEYKSQRNITIVLLNAFCQEIYYALHDPTADSISYGYAPAESYIRNKANTSLGVVNFLGNGAELYKDIIQHYFGDRAQFSNHELASLESVAQRALSRWNRQETSEQLMPVYLKEHSTTILS